MLSRSVLSLRRGFTTSSGVINGLRRFSTASNAVFGTLTREKLLSFPSTPIISPSYPQGPYRFRNREYFITVYETTREALLAAVPEPLVPNSENLIYYEWIKMPDSSGFGSYEESGAVIPCTHAITGEKISYTAMMYLDIEPPIACGREIWGFPKKNARPKLTVEGDTLVGKLDYAGQEIARGTMTYKHKQLDREVAIKALTGTQCNLKIIPSANIEEKNPSIARLVAYNLQDVEIIEAWEGPARIHFTPHANAAVGIFPIKQIVGGKHYKANLTLPYGFVLHDYLKPYGSALPSNPGALSREKILEAPSMPVLCPSYPRQKPLFEDREFLIVEYSTSDIEALRKLIPDSLELDPAGKIFVQWVNTQGSGLGDYSKIDVHTPVYKTNADGTKKKYNFSLISVSSNSAAITFGREIYGQPHKYGLPSLKVQGDTIAGNLLYSGQVVAEASMAYNHTPLSHDIAKELLTTEELNLKLIPHVDGRPEIAQLVGVYYNNLKVKSAWQGPARLHLIPHVNAPLADLPVGEVRNAYHIVCDLSMSTGEIIHDYLH